MTVKCQLYSDIHLEFYNGNPGKSRDKYTDKILNESCELHAKYLFLAGDIGNNVKSVSKFISRLQTEGKWERIFFVPGNHEYYGNVKPLPEAISQYSEALGDVFLHHRRVILPEMTVIGATLWSHPTYEAFSQMNDEKRIHGKKRKLQLHELVDMHVQDKAYLSAALDLPYEMEISEEGDLQRKPNLVMTHHSPSFLLETEISDYSCSYYSNCNHLLEKADIWLYGHTHIPVETKIEGCRIYSNPLGYPGECERPNFSFTFEV